MSESSAPPPQNVGPAQQAANAAAAGKAGANAAGGTTYNSSTIIHNMEDLRTKAPDLYKSMTESIAQNIITQNNRFTKRLKEIREREEQQNKG